MASQASGWNLSGLNEAFHRVDGAGEVRYLGETDSTNTQCSAWLREGELGGVVVGVPAGSLRYGVVVAEHQWAGRGRVGRVWQGARGASLTFSLWFRFQRRDLSGLSLAVGITVCEAIAAQISHHAQGRASSGWRVALKWPNDIVHVPSGQSDFLKLGGILVEAMHKDDSCTAVIGVGINVADFEADSGRLSTGFVSLDRSGCRLSPCAWLHHVGPALLQGVLQFERSGFAEFGTRFDALNVLLGRCVLAAGSSVPGVVEGLGADGCLLVRNPDGAVARIHASEVRLQAC